LHEAELQNSLINGIDKSYLFTTRTYKTCPVEDCLLLEAPNMDMLATTAGRLVETSFPQAVLAMQEKKLKHNGQHMTAICWTTSHANTSSESSSVLAMQEQQYTQHLGWDPCNATAFQEMPNKRNNQTGFFRQIATRFSKSPKAKSYGDRNITPSTFT
jgi:hypothetical protein